MDIDNMKRINDEYTHSFGDRALKIVANAIKDSIREREDVAVRFGGDEMLILLPNSHEGSAKDVIKRVRKRLSKISFPEEIKLSAGIALWEPGDDMEKVINLADRRMYDYKFKKAKKERKFKKNPLFAFIHYSI